MEPNERLKASRERAGFKTAADAARRYAWSLPTYRSHENGIRGLTPENVRPYARAFKVSAGWLLTGEGSEVSPPSIETISEVYDRLSPAGKRAVLASAQAFADLEVRLAHMEDTFARWVAPTVRYRSEFEVRDEPEE